MRRRAIFANSLTALRLLLTPPIAWTILKGRYEVAVGIFVAAAVTDSLDGIVARRLGAITRFGAYLDPITDKIFLSAIYICLALAGAVPWWLVGLIFGRDILILATAGCLMLAAGVREFTPSVWGKLSTFVQISTAVTVMVSEAGGWTWAQPIREAAYRLAAATTIWSGCHYGWRAARLLRRPV